MKQKNISIQERSFVSDSQTLEIQPGRFLVCLLDSRRYKVFDDGNSAMEYIKKNIEFYGIYKISQDYTLDALTWDYCGKNGLVSIGMKPITYLEK